MGGGYYLLTNRNTNQTNNQALLNEFSKDLLVNDRAIIGVGDVEITRQYSTPNNFAIVRDSANGDHVYAWGRENSYGQLGIGNTNSVTVPTQVKGLPSNAKVKFVSGGTEFTLVVLADNSIWATGKNDYGQFGNGKDDPTTTITQFVEVREASSVVISAIGTGSSAVAAIMGDKLYTWGNNNYAQLGIGDSAVKSKNSPQEVTSIPSTEKLGELKVSRGVFYLSTLNTADNTIKDLYAWGSNNFYQLGLDTEQLYWLPTLQNFSFNGKLTGFYPVFNKVYFTTKNESSFYFYGSGYTQFSSLGNGYRDGKSGMFLITQIPTDVRIENVWSSGYFTLAVTDSADIYSCGTSSNSLLPTESAFFKKSTVSGFKDFYGSTDSLSTATFTIKDNQLYAWGSASFYGTGGSDTSYFVPTLIQPFSSKHSSMSQVKIDNTIVLNDLAASIYDTTTGLDMAVFNEWVKTDSFPVGTVFSMKTAPVVDNINNQLTMTVNASSSFSSPDGAKALNTDFTVTLKKTVADSTPQTSVTKPWLNHYRYDNIISAMGEGDNTNQVSVKNSFDLSLFPNSATYKIDTPTISFDPATRKGTYKANLTASEYYLNNTLHTDGKSFKIILDGFDLQPDSEITQKTGIDTTIYNLTSIDRVLRPSGVLDYNVFTEIFDISSFPDGTTFTSSKGEVIANDYHIIVNANNAWVDGVIKSDIGFTAIITGLTYQADSSITQKPGIDTIKYNLTSIDRVLRPNGVLNETVFEDLFTLTDFPANITFVADKSEIIDTNYNISIIASQAWVDGFIKDNVKLEKTITGLNFQPDSNITARSDIDTNMYNLTNINRKLHPNGALDNGLFVALFSATNFPTTTFTSSRGEIINDEYHLYVNATQSWVDGFNIPNKQFTAIIAGLSYRPDSSIIKLEISDSEINDIIKTLEAEKEVDRTIIGKLIDLSEFPTDAKFIVNKIDNTTNGPSFEFTPDKIYKDGDAVLNDTVTKLTFKVDYTKPPVAPVDNTGLIVGLSIGGVLLLLIIIGLIIWYFKHKNKNGNADNQSVLY